MFHWNWKNEVNCRFWGQTHISLKVSTWSKNTLINCDHPRKILNTWNMLQQPSSFNMYTAIIIHSYGFDGLATFDVAARFGHSASTSRARALKQNLFRPVRERFAGQSGHRWTRRSSKRSHLWMFHPRSIKTHLVSSFNLRAEGISHLEKKKCRFPTNRRNMQNTPYVIYIYIYLFI